MPISPFRVQFLFASVAAVALTAIAPSTSQALPSVSVDVVAADPGIQLTTAIPLGSQLVVDIAVENVDAAAGESLNAFEFDLAFDSAVFSAVSVTEGSFALSPGLVIQQSLGVVSVDFAHVAIGPVGSTGGGTLAQIVFNTVGIGTSPLAINNLVLSQPFGVVLNAQAVNSGSATVTAIGAPIPEPGAAMLFMVGAVVAGLRIPRSR